MAIVSYKSHPGAAQVTGTLWVREEGGVLGTVERQGACHPGVRWREVIETARKMSLHCQVQKQKSSDLCAKPVAGWKETGHTCTVDRACSPVSRM